MDCGGQLRCHWLGFKIPPNCRLSDWRGTAIRGGAPAFGVAAFQVGHEVQIAGPIVEKADASRRAWTQVKPLPNLLEKGNAAAGPQARKRDEMALCSNVGSNAGFR
jgi:hypothetical protein